jgi:electron transport complex protein RnfG
MADEKHNPQKSEAPPAEDGGNSLRMISTMGIIGLLAGALIVLTFQVTFPVIQKNKAEALERAIFEVVPGATSKRTYQVSGEGLEILEGENAAVRKYYAAYDSTGALAGIAIEAAGQGFQDILRILYGYDPRCQCVVGFKVLESRETPGLGDKIEKDENFLANFEALDVKLAGDGASMAHPVEMAKRGEKTDPWQVEAITGATISSRAIANILRVSSTESVPFLTNNLDTMNEDAP